jgi:hypothetical protein
MMERPDEFGAALRATLQSLRVGMPRRRSPLCDNVTDFSVEKRLDKWEKQLPRSEGKSDTFHQNIALGMLNTT